MDNNYLVHMLSACWLIGAYFLAVSSHKRGRLNTSVYGNTPLQTLAEADTADVLRATKRAADKWEDVGLALGLHLSDLDVIRSDYRESYERLKRVVSQWLKGNGKECSWEVLCDALRDELVQRPNLAKNIETTYLK